ncbi:MAG: hypothetical protein H0U75_00120 [Legionella sp.]|nr:hypothetical protein [Legionella sp.]
MKKAIALLLLALHLSACGFHLRGIVEIPSWLRHISIIYKDQDTEFISLLTSQLETHKIHIESEPAHAPYWLMIDSILYQKQIVSIGSSTNPRQYQLILGIEFSLQSCKGELIMPSKRVIVTRQLTVNNDRILGSNDEERHFIKEMRRDAVYQIINRLGATNEIPCKLDTKP